jgi:hypothetical protein
VILANLSANWACWGHLSVDCGRELYVAGLLAEGKTLYRDVWYLYHPAAPYLNSLLFRLFGVRVEVLYLAGTAAACGSAIFLYLTGLRFGLPLAGWTAGCLLLVEAFERSLFSFPLAYSFASVYGCFTACLFLWLLVSACFSSRRAWIVGLGLTAAAAMLCKLEFGAACYAALAALVVFRAANERSWRCLFKDVAAVLPGVAICTVVGAWMVSLGGLEFLLQENLATWPTSYFMRTYGKFWLASTGMEVTLPAFQQAFSRGVVFACWLLTLFLLFWWRRKGTYAWAAKLVMVGTLLLLTVGDARLSTDQILGQFWFPQDMVLYAALAFPVAFYIARRDPISARKRALAFLLLFVPLLAFRILLHATPSSYPIYYNGPAILALLTVAFFGIERLSKTSAGTIRAQSIASAACLLTVGFHAWSVGVPKAYRGTLKTDRGLMRPEKAQAENYAAAIQFMREKKAAGQSVLSVPEDTSLYFFSGVEAPTRVFAFTPGVVAPGPMLDRLLAQLDTNPPQYLLWSNRIYPEYNAPVFGKDFDVRLGAYLRQHYHRLGFLPPHSGSYGDWQVAVWERN